MKRKSSVSHDEAIIRRLRKDPEFAAEYLKAALEDHAEPRVLLIALRHLAGMSVPQSPLTRANIPASTPISTPAASPNRAARIPPPTA